MILLSLSKESAPENPHRYIRTKEGELTHHNTRAETELHPTLARNDDEGAGRRSRL